ncbi:Ankyrin repeat domain-containing protein 13A [Bagarius yarrelli]|uniref:Ankyrin repeat domain-containing protein 13A n=1 Tax=Bagarius yarrelli TaxID=175774 RepID=A0A556V0X4_BAGYA|nr:Ankyrin repeat domain-containing protein 13A [Bagarius yarrelli]
MDFKEKFPLHLLVWENDYRQLEKQINAHEIELVDPRGRTPLHLAVSLGHLESVRVLLRHGAQVTKENTNNWTVPLVSRVCPSDVCRIWKSESCAELIEVNHDDEVVDTERIDITRELDEVTLDSMQPDQQEVAKRLTTPIVNTFLDTKNISFERCKSGIWGWRTDRTEIVNGFEAKVFSVNNVNVVIRTRTEHLTDEEKARIKSERYMLESFLGTVEQQISAQGDLTLEYATATNPTAITPEEYFNPDFDLKDRDIGRPIELTIRTQRFKGTLWMSEEHPLSLVKQVTPIIDLMARTSTHFARLRDFIQLRFPPGFPVKIEIPLFHVLNARITFGNVNKCSTDEPADVSPSATPSPTEEQERESGEASGVAPFQNTWGVSNGVSMLSLSDGNVSEGVLVDLSDTTPTSTDSASSPDSDLQLAIELSARAQEEEEQRRKEEEEELEKILQLSLMEK